MAVKYVKEFDYPSEGGFHKSKMPSRAMPNAPARGAARMESKPKMGKGQGYAKGGKVQKYARGGPSTREPTGPGSPQVNYIPNPFGKSIRNVLGSTGGGYPRVEMRSPVVMDKNLRTIPNPNYIPGLDPEYTKTPQDQDQAMAKGGKVGKVMREYKAGKLHSGKNGKVVKNPKQAMAIALSEARKSGEKVKKLARGGPSSREPTGPTSKQVGYFPNPFGKSIRFEKGPSGGGYQRSYKYDSPFLMDANFRTYPNPDYDPKYDRREADPQMARGGKVAKRANGGMMSKGPSTRRSSESDRAQSRMEFAEKYAPGLSLDMPGRRVRKK